MAEGMSGRGAYWLGAFTGLVFSAAVGAALSIWLPQAGVPAEPVDVVAAPEREDSDTASVPAPEAAPEPEAPAAVEPAAAPEADAAPEPDPAPEPAAPAPAAGGDAPPPVSAEADPAPEAESAPVVAAPGAPSPPVDPEPAATASAEAAAPPPATVGAPAETPPAAPEPLEDAAAPVAPETLAEAPDAAAPPSPLAEPAPATDGAEAEAAEIEPGPPGLALNRTPFDGAADAPILVVVLSGVDEAAFEDAARLPFPVTLLLSVRGEAGARLAAAAQAAGLEAVSPSPPDEAAGPVIGVALTESLADRDAFFAALTASDLALLDISAPGGSTEFRQARAAGLQAAPLGLRIDEIANSEIVYQSLERAALEARKRGVFVAVGEANPAVLAGLRRWMSVKAGKTIALAPLSAAIDRQPAR